MAMPIKETPTLTGEDARIFSQAISENMTKKISEEDYKRAEDVFKKVMANNKGFY